MRLFGYYAWHTFKNQLRKLLKTWVLIFLLVCFLLGGVIGVGVAMLEDAAQPEEPDFSETIPQEPVPPEEPSLPEDMSKTLALAELIAGGVILGVFVLMAALADKNGSRIFLPADVNLLFPSPLKPQSVLLFRLLTQLGLVIVSSVYLLFQLPNLVVNLGLGFWAAVGVLLAWLLTLAVAQLLQVLLYTVSSTYPGVKKHLRTGLYALLAVLAGAFILFIRRTGLEPLPAAEAFFNAPVTRWIPLWGWIKSLLMCALEGNLAGALASAGAVTAAGAVLIGIIWRLPADFYEDALAKSQETAQLLEVAQAEKSVGFVRRKKDRSEKLCRDGMTRGWGAKVFFWRTLYNRFRFAHFGVLTKTSETYLAAAIGVGALCRFALHTDVLLPVVLTLGGLIFFRALGNPLAEDTGKDFFRMIPESTGKKLFYSILGGTTVCLMDLLPALAVTVLVWGAPVLQVLAWCIFLLSMDVYSTNVGAFIDLSVPGSVGKTVKQVVQVLFVYFGMLPDIAILAVGFVTEQVAGCAVGAAALNLALGGLVLCLMPLLLEPRDRPVRVLPTLTPEDRRLARRHFRILGLGCCAILVSASVLQLACIKLLPDAQEQPWAMWVYTFAPIYLVAFPLGVLIFRTVPKCPRPRHPLKAGQMVKLGFIAVFMMYGSNFVATLLLSLLPQAAQPGILEFAMADTPLLKFLVMVILAPLLEEFIFRRQLIDRMAPYGGKLAVVTSALLFGLFHGNLAQFLYATALGLVLGYVYYSTGRLRYSVGIHMGINFLGSMVSGWLLENLDLEALADPERMMQVMTSPIFAAWVGFLAFILVSCVIGLVLLCRNARRIRFDVEPRELGRGKWRIAWGNVGMLLFTLLCGVSIVLTLVG